jgi:hypothetical protein
MRKITISIFGFLALSAAVGFLATNGLPGGNEGAASGRAPVASATMAPAGVAYGAVDAQRAPTETSGSGGGGAGVVTSSGAGSAVSGPSGGLSGIGGIPAIGAVIVKTASLEVQVPKGDFESAFRSALLVADRYVGYVESSSTSGTRIRSGSLTVRVPSSSFDQAMRDLSGLGTVRSRSISGQDVTNEYVDLNARLRTWQAQEAVLLRLMRRATSVEATLRVQSNLQDVQFRIEQIKGQLRVLQNQTQLATIDVAIHEPGVPLPGPPRTRPDERPSLAEAWTKAVDGFLGVLYATVVGLGYLVPVALIGLAVWFAVRRARPVASPPGAPAVTS